MPSTPARNVLEIDGRTLEGGGQLLRLAIGLSSLTDTPIRVTDIRGNRSAGGGLKPQHLACVTWLAHASNATISGAEKGSKVLYFRPATVETTSPAYRLVQGGNGRGSYWESRLDIKTAGSTGLALQAILPFILFRPPRNDDGTLSNLPIRLTVSGGTNVSASPSYDYITQVLLPTLHNIGLPPMSATLNKRGWSNGGSSIGSFTLDIPARRSLSLRAFHLLPDDPTSSPNPPDRIEATLIAPTAAHSHLRQILRSTIRWYFDDRFSEENHNFSITCEDSQHDKRYYLILVATVPPSTTRPDSPTDYKLGSDWLYDRRVRSPEQTANELAGMVTRNLHSEWSSGAYVDEHMRDQLVVFQALAESGSQTHGGVAEDAKPREPSLHAKTAQWIVEQLIG